MSRARCLIPLVAMVLGFGLGGVQASQPLETQPILRLETGLHTSVLRAASVDASGHLLLTASEDKTARVWELPSGRLLRTLRPAAGPGNQGKLYAGALAPDGRLAALGGWTGDAGERHAVLLVDPRSGDFLRRIEVGAETVNFLAFSPDGRTLAVHLGGRLGLRFLRMPEGTVVGQDLDFDQATYRGAFDGAGRYAASADDGFVRLYDASHQRVRKVRLGGAGAPFGVAFNPDGSLLAVAQADQPQVTVLRGADLAEAFVPAAGSQPLGLVAWSSDGQTLLASGGEDYGPRPNVLRRWSQGGRGPAMEVAVARATVSELAVLPEGRLFIASQEPGWSLLDGAGQAVLSRAVNPMDLREAREAFRVSGDGRVVGLPGALGAFSFADLNLAPPVDLPAPRRSAAGLEPQGWRDQEHPTLGGRPLGLDPHEVSRVVSVAPDASAFLLGTDWWLRAFDAQGNPRWQSQAPAPIWGLAHRADGRAVAALLADGTVRWYRTSDGREVLALHVAADRRWVAWTPSGRFATSVGGEALVGWQVNQGWQAAAFFPVGHFRDRYYQPELLPALLDTLDEPQALQRLNAAAPASAALPPVAAPTQDELPPLLRILEPAEGAALPAGPQVLSVLVRTFGPARGIKAFHLFRDGQRLPSTRGLRPQQKGGIEEGAEATFALPLRLPEGEVTLSLQVELEGGKRSETVHLHLKGQAPAVVVAPAGAALPGAALPTVGFVTASGASSLPATAAASPVPGAQAAPLSLPAASGAPTVTAVPPPPPETALAHAPNLRVLAVGVATYANPKNNLRFAAKDAQEVADLFRQQAGRLFATVEAQVLLNEAATEQAILKALDDLAASSNPASVTVLFLSAHGASNPERTTYAFVPYDFGVGSRGLPGPELKARLERTQGKVLLLMDTCHSGNVLGEGRMRSLDDVIRRVRFINELLQAGPGSVVFSSSSGAQYSLESPAWGNGAFTKALKEGLGGAADPQKTGRVTTDALDAWLRARVAELTQGRQTPVIGKSEGLPAFPLVMTAP